MARPSQRLSWCTIVALAAACASNGAPSDDNTAPRANAPKTSDTAESTQTGAPPIRAAIAAGTLHATGRETDFDKMFEDLAGADVVYVGEQHDNPHHHAIQRRVIEELWRAGRLHAIGMEMFQRPYQSVLDDFVEGRIDEATMLERTEWKKRWGFDVALYRPIFDFARQKRLPIVALNVSNELRKKVREGLDTLTIEERASLPVLRLDDKEHRAFLEDVYRQHLPEGTELNVEKFERFYRIMVLWDEVMADSVVRWFRRSPKDAQIVVLAGGGHIGNRYGIPGRAHRRDGRRYRSVICVVAGDGRPSDEQFSPRFGDYLWVTEPKPEPPPKETAAAYSDTPKN
ncbi:MAG: ChaN family lipoprotein [Planctomycetota bacterium]